MEWYHARDVVDWSQSDNDDIVLTVSTSDPKGRVIVVHIGGFVGERQFSLNAVVKGDDASKRCVDITNSLALPQNILIERSLGSFNMMFTPL